MVKTLNYLAHRCLLPAEASVGRNVTLEHYALGIVMHPQVVIGDDSVIYHHVTFAAESGIGSPHRIVIGKRVVVGAHVVIVARSNASLYIGDDVIIGAGSVVTKDIPRGEIWAGNPACKLKSRSVELA